MTLAKCIRNRDGWEDMTSCAAAADDESIWLLCTQFAFYVFGYWFWPLATGVIIMLLSPLRFYFLFLSLLMFLIFARHRLVRRD